MSELKTVDFRSTNERKLQRASEIDRGPFARSATRPPRPLQLRTPTTWNAPCPLTAEDVWRKIRKASDQLNTGVLGGRAMPLAENTEVRGSLFWPTESSKPLICPSAHKRFSRVTFDAIAFDAID